MSLHNIGSRGDCKLGTKTGETCELQVQLLYGNAMLLVRGSARIAGHDLCAANSCVIPSRGKGIVEIGLAVSLPLRTYARIAPHSEIAIQKFIGVGVAVLDSDCWGEIKVVLFHHSAKDFTIQAIDRIA